MWPCASVCARQLPFNIHAVDEIQHWIDSKFIFTAKSIIIIWRCIFIVYWQRLGDVVEPNWNWSMHSKTVGRVSRCLTSVEIANQLLWWQRQSWMGANRDIVIVSVIILSLGLLAQQANGEYSLSQSPCAHRLLIELLKRNLCFYNFVENKFDIKAD